MACNVHWGKERIQYIVGDVSTLACHEMSVHGASRGRDAESGAKLHQLHDVARADPKESQG